MPTKKITLDKYEQDIEDNFKKLIPIADMKKKIHAMQQAATFHTKRRRKSFKEDNTSS